MRKDELRQQMRQIKRQFTQQQLEELSLPIVARLKDRIKDAQTVVAYYPLPDEVDIRPLLDDLVAAGKTVFLPKVTDDTTMELRRYTGQQDLREGAYHIMEPVGEDILGDSSVAQIIGTDPVVLVPGMAFDSSGHRLGRGRGYYDRFLIAHPCVIIGVCFDFQKVPEVPTDEHDVPVDEVI